MKFITQDFSKIAQSGQTAYFNAPGASSIKIYGVRRIFNGLLNTNAKVTLHIPRWLCIKGKEMCVCY